MAGSWAEFGRDKSEEWKSDSAANWQGLSPSSASRRLSFLKQAN